MPGSSWPDWRDGAIDLIEDVTMFRRLVSDVPSFLRRPIDVEQARAELRERLATRERRFLALAERAIYRHRLSPYAHLLRHAGCELGDLRRLVSQEGLEGALRILARQGVYVTFDEMKGRAEAVRGSARFRFRERDFVNPLDRPHFAMFTGGTRGRPTRAGRSLALLAEIAAKLALVFEAHGLPRRQHLLWWTGPVDWLLMLGMLRQPIAGWYHPLRPLPRRVSLGARFLRLYSRRIGARFPLPQYCPLDDPGRIVARLAPERRGDLPMVVNTIVSSGVRISLAAQRAGIDLTGVTFFLQSEPLSEDRRRAIEASGARVIGDYGSIELALIGYSCAAPAAADDLHFFHDRHAPIEHRRPLDGLSVSVDALLLTSLTEAAPRIALNAELGDAVQIGERDASCCALGELGLTTHMSNIRSFEKLTGEGTTFLRGDFQHILESLLPSRFGGSALDYQLVETIGSDTATRLVLRIHPSVGPLDETIVCAALLAELARGGVIPEHQAELWRRAGTIAVVREAPLATDAGKVLPFHLVRQAPMARQ